MKQITPPLDAQHSDSLRTSPSTDPVQLLIFDWDGTLFNSVGQIVASLQYAAQQYQQPLTDAAAQSIIGLGLPEVMQILFPQVPALHQAILESYSAHYVEHSVDDHWFEERGRAATGLKTTRPTLGGGNR